LSAIVYETGGISHTRILFYSIPQTG